MWDRKLWGVWFNAPRTEGFLISDTWDNYRPVVRAEEPTRALLFTTRKAAREWCKARLAYYSDHNICKDRKFRAVRVWERVTVIR